MNTSTLEQPVSETIEPLLEEARARARSMGNNYRGALLPQEAWLLTQHLPQARLVDIRTSAEWELIGSVPGALQVEWKLYPDWERNPHFLDQLENLVSSHDYIILLCRSGIRSREAAEWLTREGYNHVFNVLEGFEGNKNEAGQRTLEGWKVRGLPWSQ